MHERRFGWAAPALSAAVVLAACGGAAPEASEPRGGGADVGPMRYASAVADHRAEICDRYLAIVGPRVERSCPDGSRETRGSGTCDGETGLPRVPDECPATVDEMEACFRSLAALPECAGMGAMLAAATGPACQPMADCRRGPPAPAPHVAGDPLTHAALDQMMAAVAAAYPDQTFEVTFGQLSERYGAPMRTNVDAHTWQWWVVEDGTCWVFTLEDPSDATYAAGSVFDDADGSDCAP